MTEATYTQRTLKMLTLKSKDGGLTSTDGSGCWAPQDVQDLLEVGDEYGLEVKGFNRISGFFIKGQWYHHKSDQEIIQQDEESIRSSREKHIKFVEENRAVWTRREEALPDWAKKLMADARQRRAEKGEDFDTAYMGWGYMLVASELAVLYATLGDVLKNAIGGYDYDVIPDHIKKFENENGVSGNQVDWAWMIARAKLNNQLE